MSNKIEIPIPPETLPLLHDAMCTINCIVLKFTGPIGKIEKSYDEDRGLKKVTIHGNVNIFLKTLDDLFQSQKLKPSLKIEIGDWFYRFEPREGIAYLYMGDKYLSKGATGVGRNFIDTIIRRQCYLSAKGQQFISIREEEKRQAKLVSGYLKVGVASGIAQMFNTALNRCFSYRLISQKGDFRIYILLGDIPLEQSIIDSVVSYLYSKTEEGLIEVNANIKQKLTPYNIVDFLVETPDIMYYNLLFRLVYDYSTGTIDVTNWPPIRIYVYSEDLEKSVLAFFSINYRDIDSLFRTLSSFKDVYGIDVSDIVVSVDSFIDELCRVVKSTPKREEVLRCIEMLIPFLRIFLNELAIGKLNTTVLYEIVRKLVGFESVESGFRDVTKKLYKLISAAYI